MRLRTSTGMSRPELARRLSVDPTTVWRWETGRQKPESTAVPEALAALFRLDLDEVLAAAGLRPDPPAVVEPPEERDEEMELILTAKVNERMKMRMIERLLELRERDKQRRMEDIRYILERGA